MGPLYVVDCSFQLYGHRIQLAIALLKYKTRLQKPREGVCSAWIARLEPPKRLPIRIIPGTLLLPAQPSTPILTIGPGTGIAPLRAIVQERIASTPPIADNTVVVGCRYTARDLLFRAEWSRLADKCETPPSDASATHDEVAAAIDRLAIHQPLIRLYIAASREQKEKVYVQDVLRQHGAEVWNILGPRRGIAYLSGYVSN